MCSRVIYLKRGWFHFDLPTDEGIEIYEQDFPLSPLAWAEQKPGGWPERVTDCALLDVDRARKSIFEHDETIRMRLTHCLLEPVAAPNFVVSFVRTHGAACCNYSTVADSVLVERDTVSGVIELSIPPIELVAGACVPQIVVRKQGLHELLGAQMGEPRQVRHPVFNDNFSIFDEPASWALQGQADRPATPPGGLQ
jgi:lipopolysaccharide transport system ATP-binding protein